MTGWALILSIYIISLNYYSFKIIPLKYIPTTVAPNKKTLATHNKICITFEFILRIFWKTTENDSFKLWNDVPYTLAKYESCFS